MALRNEEVLFEKTASRPRPIEYVTENGFSIIRRSDVKMSSSDSVQECSFVVRHPRGGEREVTVEFNDQVMAQIKNNGRKPLPAGSTFWVNCAERCLATYLWEKNGYPPASKLTISELCGDELILATYWRD